ncbi:MAG: MBL fold metallo-hydrolase [Verrucomicrobiales bacterium]
MIALDWTALSDGWTEAPKAAVLPGNSWNEKLRFHAVAFLLVHPAAGPVLIDTGYSARFFAETRFFPGSLYGAITPVTLTDPEGIAGQIRRLGMSPGEVRHLVITHFHADHIGGLCDFPNARVYCSQRAWQYVRKLRGFAAVRHAFLRGLLPSDLEGRLHFVVEGGDLFGDGAIHVIDLPGHAPGQIGIRFTDTTGRSILLAADACWTSDAFRKNRMPHPVTRLLNEWKPYRTTLRRLHRLHREEPDLLILPTHCPETAQYLG